ncbi:MAG: hypothetical protein ABSH56_04565 [Bryobacteraceae bacterium]|jgi:hypothetical protein
MPTNENWIPLRWPSAWIDPALLGLLDGTPFNCLAMEWQAALGPVVAKARSVGLSLVAIGDEAARSAGAASGLLLPPEDLLIAADSVWPGIASQAVAAEASGPTANPWIDSNGWLLRLARVRSPRKTVWLMFEPPGAPNVVLLESYLRAVADSGAWGGRWVVSVDSHLRDGLARGDAKALSSWKAIAAAVRFFEQRSGWGALEPLGTVGVVSDFAGPNESASGEILNLLGRRNLAYRILEASVAATASLLGFHALIYVDEGAPAPPLRRRLLAFAEQGGLVLVAAAWNRADGKPTGMDHPRVDVRWLGKGRLAVCKDSSPDPFMIARDVHMLLGRTYDVARFFNLSAFLSYCTASPDRTRELVQIVSFAIRFPNDPATTWVPGKYASAHLWSLGSEGPSPVEMAPENGGTSLLLPPVPVYAGVELVEKLG